VLAVVVVQVLAALSLVGILAVVLVGGPRLPSVKTPPRIVARRAPARWTEGVWVGGAATSVLWNIGVLAAPRYAYDWPSLPDVSITAALQLVGFAVSLVGGALFLASARALGRYLTPAIQIQEDHRIVQSGPYRRIRHPVYTGIVASAFGLSLLFLSLPLLGVALLLLVMAGYRARLEEDLLSSPEGFGPAYREYVSRTGRFLPRLR